MDPYQWFWQMDHGFLTFMVLVDLIVTCIGMGMLVRLLFAAYRTVRETTQMLSTLLVRMDALHLAINGRFDILHQQLLTSQQQNLTLRDELAVAEQRERDELRRTAHPEPSSEG